MKSWIKIVALLCLGSVCATAQSAQAKWKVDLTEKYGFQAFDRTINFRWTLHQGLLFISPDRVLVYQVNRLRGTTKLAPRDASGGSGNFILDIKVLNAADASEIKSLQLPTNAEFSKVLATHNGQFIVRTGDILYLYSADFTRLASHPLPLKRQVQEEGWQIGVSSSGDEVQSVHQQILKRSAISPTSKVEKAQADIEILSADNLETIKSFSLPWFLASWSGADRALLSSSPTSYSPSASFGLLTFDGQWTPLLPDWASSEHPCAYQAVALEHKLFAAFGCGNLSVFPQTGERLFFLETGTKEFVNSVLGGGDYMAIQWEHHSIRRDTSANIPIAVAQPLRIDLYNIRSSNPLLTVPLHHNNIYYAVSQNGALAVVDGTSLNLYSPTH
jgi:hypothetical protein